MGSKGILGQKILQYISNQKEEARLKQNLLLFGEPGILYVYKINMVKQKT